MSITPRNISLQTGSGLAHCFDACTFTLHRKALLALGLGIVLSACEGGGSTGGGSMSTTQPLPLSSNPYVAIAEAIPKAGSITQSSRIGSDRITLDSISSTLNSNGSLTIRNGNNWTMTFIEDPGNNVPGIWDYDYQPVTGTIKQSQAEIDFWKSIDKQFYMGCTNCDPLPREFDAGNGQYVYSGGRVIGTDYMVLGDLLT